MNVVAQSCIYNHFVCNTWKTHWGLLHQVHWDDLDGHRWPRSSSEWSTQHHCHSSSRWPCKLQSRKSSPLNNVFHGKKEWKTCGKISKFSFQKPFNRCYLRLLGLLAMAGKDLVSSLCSGLLTIGPRFGGALDDAAKMSLGLPIVLKCSTNRCQLFCFSRTSSDFFWAGTWCQCNSFMTLKRTCDSTEVCWCAEQRCCAKGLIGESQAPLHSAVSPGLDWEDEEEQPADHGHWTQDQVLGKPWPASHRLRLARMFSLFGKLASDMDLRWKLSRDLRRRTLNPRQCWTMLWQWKLGSSALNNCHSSTITPLRSRSPLAREQTWFWTLMAALPCAAPKSAVKLHSI